MFLSAHRDILCAERELEAGRVVRGCITYPNSRLCERRCSIPTCDSQQRARAPGMIFARRSAVSWSRTRPHNAHKNIQHLAFTLVFANPRDDRRRANWLFARYRRVIGASLVSSRGPNWSQSPWAFVVAAAAASRAAPLHEIARVGRARDSWLAPSRSPQHNWGSRGQSTRCFTLWPLAGA